MLTTAVQSTGIDWLTGYCKATDEQMQEFLAEQAFQLEVKEVEAGNELKQFSSKGFKGSCIGGIGIAYDDAGNMLIRMSSRTARENALNAMLLGARPSRLDLQVTVVTGRRVEGVAMKARRDSEAESLYHRNRWRVSSIEVPGHGETAYIGSVKSDMYCRIYDKERESKQSEYRNCWRYELVLRNDYAIQAGRVLLKEQFPHYVIQATVYDWLKKRGVEPLFDRGATQAVLFEVPPETDIERKLQWVETSVTPLLRRAVAAGHGERVTKLFLQSGLATGLVWDNVLDSGQAIMPENGQTGRK